MPAIDVFCERCGARQPTERRERATANGGFTKRLASAVGLTADGVARQPPDMFLRLCLECRGYSCPACWNEEVGLCQTCAPLPVVEAPRPAAEPPRPVVEAPRPVSQPSVQPVPEPAPPAVATSDQVEQERFIAPLAPLPPMPPVAPAPQPEPIALHSPAAPLKPLAAPEPPAAPMAPPVPVAPIRLPGPAPMPVAATAVTPSEDPVMPAPVVQPRLRPMISFDDLAAAPPPAFAPMAAAAAPLLSQPRAYLPVPQRAVEAPPAGIRPCRSCLLPLSAKAHFCRRCGSAQES